MMFALSCKSVSVHQRIGGVFGLALAGVAIPLLISCAQMQHGQSHAGHSANAHMHRHNFDELVARFESPDRAEWQKPDKVIDLLEPLEGKTVADIGSGSGYFTFRIASRAPRRVIAIDIDQRFLDYIAAKQNPGVETRLTTPDSPGLEGGEADTVLIVNTYHHIEDRVNYLRKLKAGIADGGALVIVDYRNEPSPHGPPVEIRLAQSEVEAELKRAGFTVELADHQTLPEQYILKARPMERHPQIGRIRAD
jgi:SAM-dependent methyltransferase